MQEIPQHLKNVRLFNQLPPHSLMDIASTMILHRIPRREIVYNEGDRQKFVFLILGGSVKTQICREGLDKKILNFHGPGEFLGIETAAAATPFYLNGATCHEDSTILEIPMRTYHEKLRRLAQIEQEIQNQIAQRISELQNDIYLAPAFVPEKIAEFLLNLRINIPLTRLNIAEKIGSQSETVTRVLTSWTRAGWIATRDRRIEILNRPALEKISPRKPLFKRY